MRQLFFSLVLSFFAVVSFAEKVVVNISCAKEGGDMCGIYFPEYTEGGLYQESLLATLKAGTNQRCWIELIFCFDLKHWLVLISFYTLHYRREAVELGTALVIRSSDLQTRMRLEFHPAEDPIASNNNPYILSLYNMAHFDRRADPVELQHSNSGYIWIERNHFLTWYFAWFIPVSYSSNQQVTFYFSPCHFKAGNVVTHNTDVNHVFTLRNTNKMPVFSVTLNYFDQEL